MNAKILNLVLATTIIFAFGITYAGKDDSKNPAGNARATPTPGSNIGSEARGNRTSDLEVVVCGNGRREGGEQCDDGNNVNGDGCTCSCFLEPVPRSRCGNGVCEVGENVVIVNGSPDRNYPTRCLRDCSWATVPSNEPPAYYVQCGNCAIDARGEECDDGNRINGDGCSSACTREPPPPPVCGNGILESGEECDDGNNMDGDQCSRTCLNEPHLPAGPVSSSGSPLSCQEAMEQIMRETPDYIERLAEEVIECMPRDPECLVRCDCRCEDFPPECNFFPWIVTIHGEFHPNIDRTKAGGHGIALDSENNSYVVGSLYNSAGSPASEGYNIVLYKFDRCGGYLWHRVVNGSPQWSGNGHDYGLGVAVDFYDNVYITGRVQKQAATAGDGVGKTIIQKYSASGVVLSTYYSENSGATEGRAIAINPQFKIFVAGMERPPSVASSRFWLGKFEFGNMGATLMPVTTSGWPVVQNPSDVRLNALGKAITISPDGNLYVLATNLPTEPPTLISRETTVMKFRQTRGQDMSYGNRGSVVFGGPNGHWFEGKDMMSDEMGNVFITGLRERPGEIYERLWIEKLDPLGNPTGGNFPIVAGDFFYSVGNGIAKTSDGFVVAGNIIPSRGAASQCLVRKYSAFGELLSSVTLSSQCKFLNDVAVGGNGNILVTGTSSSGGIFVERLLPNFIGGAR